jgi:hypothetical protein
MRGKLPAMAGSGVAWDLFLHEANHLSANHRLHWKPENDRKQVLRTLGRAQHRKLGKYQKVRFDVEVSYPRNRQRDVNNLQPTLKYYIDGLVDGGRGILPDDSDQYVLGPFMTASGQPSPKPGHYLFRITMTVL